MAQCSLSLSLSSASLSLSLTRPGTGTRYIGLSRGKEGVALEKNVGRSVRCLDCKKALTFLFLLEIDGSISTTTVEPAGRATNSWTVAAL